MVGTCGQFGLSDPGGSPCRGYMRDAGRKKDLLGATTSAQGRTRE